MRTRWLLFLVALLALLVPLPALAEGTGSVSGTVANGTAGGGPVGGLTVKLTRYQGMNVLQEYTATT
ncbi:MAG: hypothetical protein IRY97_06890, partial [Thermomicrobiaceae bacterium]|nr:hypothetical protein [Thermomicrobiaceae bacterium]